MATPKKTPKVGSQVPPVDNDHIEEGTERFDESEKTDSESDAPSTDDIDVESPAGQPQGSSATAEEVRAEDPQPKRHIRDRIKDIEKRWSKEFTEVMVDLHDHVFGTSKPHDQEETKAP